MEFSREDANKMLGCFLYDLHAFGLLNVKGNDLVNQEDLNIFIDSSNRGLLDEFYASLNLSLNELLTNGFVE